jgi:hypothetical protein
MISLRVIAFYQSSRCEKISDVERESDVTITADVDDGRGMY